MGQNESKRTGGHPAGEQGQVHLKTSRSQLPGGGRGGTESRQASYLPAQDQSARAERTAGQALRTRRAEKQKDPRAGAGSAPAGSQRRAGSAAGGARGANAGAGRGTELRASSNRAGELRASSKRTRTAAERRAAEQRAREARMRKERERRAKQLRRRLTIAVCLAAVLLAGAAWFGISSARRRSEEAREQAAAQAAAQAEAQARAEEQAEEAQEAGTGTTTDGLSGTDSAEGQTDTEAESMDIAAAVARGVSMQDEEVERIAETMRRENYPEGLVSLFVLNPEARQFVLDFKSNADKHPDIDLSEEVSPGVFPLFLQWDERWGYEMYGEGYLAQTGCGPTCLSMVYTGLSQKTDKDPYAVALLADRQGYYVEGSGSSWEIMTRFAEELDLYSEEISFSSDSVISELQEGRPVICAVGPGDFTERGHFIAIVGLNDDGTVEIRDPNSYLNTQKSWDLDQIMDQTRNLWSFRYLA